MSEMYLDKQIAEYAKAYLLTKRENALAECFTALENNGKIALSDAKSTARCPNRLVLAYAIEDALHRSYEQDDSVLESQSERMLGDCKNIIEAFITVSQSL